MPVDGVYTAVRLDDLPVAKTVDTSTPDAPLLVPHIGFGDEAVRSVLKDVDTQARVLTRPTEAMGGGTVPVVLFAPRFLVEAHSDRGEVIELQSAGIIAAGFSPFCARAIVPARLPDWSVRRTRTGVELWDQGGLWARADVAVDDAWLAAADAHGSVRVIYGVQVGVHRPEGAVSYADAERDAELMASRDAGVVAVAEVPWRGRLPQAGGQHRVARSSWVPL